ncbi:MAG: anhydro-N-acetylmuramic acid kinase [Alphaproteobacteria bacterium]
MLTISTHRPPIIALGLMSGTSLDGIDAALIKTDGVRIFEHFGGMTFPYEHQFSNALKGIMGARTPTKQLTQLEVTLTQFHAQAVQALIKQTGINPDIIGFHGQTITHDPQNGFTWQIGSGEMLAQACALPVIGDFRQQDIIHGGQGAPLAPLYHQALSQSWQQHKDNGANILLNIGGICNLTYMDQDQLYAGDCAMGNAPLNDWISKHGKGAYDQDGEFASKGTLDQKRLNALLAHPFFAQALPKSLDRQSFTPILDQSLTGLSLEDGAALLTEFSVKATANAITDLSKGKPYRLYLCGGGRYNKFLVERLKFHLGQAPILIDQMGVDGDLLEAEAFAFLAARSLYQLPLSLPHTTGASKPCVGGMRSLPVTRR